MTRLVILGLLISALGFSEAEGSNAGITISAAEFFESIKGAYTVEFAGGHAVKPEIKNASAEIEDGEAILTFPFCPPKMNEGDPEVCDPGYRYFPLDTTVVSQLTAQDGHPLYSLIVADDPTTLHHYTWEFHDSEIVFIDTQYALLSGDIMQLEFRAVKNAEN